MSAENCDAISDLLEPFMDGELALPEREAVEWHLRDCANCRQQLGELQELGDRLRRLTPRMTSAALAARVRESLDLAGQKPVSWQAWAVPIATHLSAVLIGLGIGYWIVVASSQREGQTRELLAAHVRSLMHEQPTDITSGDPHRVAPWFAGKLDFAPKVKDLTAQGFPLQGARVDYFQGRRVAVMVFRRRAHLINVFVVPNAGGSSHSDVATRRLQYRELGQRRVPLLGNLRSQCARA